MENHPRAFHVAVNGWYAGLHTSGSGQYLDHLLAHFGAMASVPRVSLLLPQGGEAPVAVPGMEPVYLPLPRLPRQLAKLWWEQITVPRAARRLQADVLWVPYWAAPAWQPIPTVVTVHDLIPLLLPEYRGGLLVRGYTRLVSWTTRRAAAVLTISEASARDIATHLQLPASRVHVVHHGPNQEGNAPGVADLERVRQRYGLPDRFFLYLGGFDVRKNMAALLAAYARYRDRGGDPGIKLVIAGKLPAQETPLFPDPRRLAVAAGCQEDVHFCGWVEEGDKAALYALATAFVFPSLYEGFGMMVLEAMQAGTPVVTSATSSTHSPGPHSR